jgi:hypothetical protein
LIHTYEFTIAGRIDSPTLKAKSPYFGEVAVQLAEARSLRSLRFAGEVEVTVDARFANHNEWMETDIEITGDDPVEIKAGGQMMLRPNGNGMECGPAGNQNYRDGNNSPGQLIGRIGKTGKTISINEHYKGSTGESGKLYLRVWPSPWGNQMSGSYNVKVILGGGNDGRAPTQTSGSGQERAVPKMPPPKLGK